MDRAEAAQLLRRLHEVQQALYASGDEAPVRALLTDDVHWHVPGRNAIAGDYQGIDAVLAYFRRRRDLVDRTFRMHPGDVLVGDGDRIAALTDGTAVVGGSSGAGRPWACTRSVMGASRAAGCCPWTRPPSTTSGRDQTRKPVGFDGNTAVRTRRDIGRFGRTKPCICARTQLQNSGAQHLNSYEKRSRVASCDLYDFTNGKVSEITSYTVEIGTQ